MQWSDIKHFQPREFDSPDAPGSGTKMNVDFVYKLQSLRVNVGQPLIIDSGYRTPDHNAQVGGVDSSAHENGYAADIRAVDSSLRFRIIQCAMRMGFRRLGVGKTFVHLDDDPTKPTDVVWLYDQTATRGQ